MRTFARYLAGSVLVCLLVVGGLAWHIVRVGQSTIGPASADAIVVLGAAEYDGRPSDVYAARLDHAADLYHQGVAPHVVPIGGRLVGDVYTEGSAGRLYLADKGLPAAALQSVDVGNDTLVSLRAAAVLLTAHGWHRIVVVTDPWHTARAARMAEDLGFAVSVSPVTDGPSVQPGVAPRYVLRETLGTLFYLLVGGSSGSGSPVL